MLARLLLLRAHCGTDRGTPGNDSLDWKPIVAALPGTDLIYLYWEIVTLAAEAGFIFVAASEINANERDTKDHPFGVDTLPPQRLTAPQGQPPNPLFDRAKYDAIGESDRMTLKLVKPK